MIAQVLKSGIVSINRKNFLIFLLTLSVAGNAQTNITCELNYLLVESVCKNISHFKPDGRDLYSKTSGGINGLVSIHNHKKHAVVLGASYEIYYNRFELPLFLAAGTKYYILNLKSKVVNFPIFYERKLTENAKRKWEFYCQLGGVFSTLIFDNENNGTFSFSRNDNFFSDAEFPKIELYVLNYDVLDASAMLHLGLRLKYNFSEKFYLNTAIIANPGISTITTKRIIYRYKLINDTYTIYKEEYSVSNGTNFKVQIGAGFLLYKRKKGNKK